jgi:hypothetical protein
MRSSSTGKLGLAGPDDAAASKSNDATEAQLPPLHIPAADRVALFRIIMVAGVDYFSFHSFLTMNELRLDFNQHECNAIISFEEI